MDCKNKGNTKKRKKKKDGCVAGVRGEGEVRWAWGRVIGGDMEGSYGFF